VQLCDRFQKLDAAESNLGDPQRADDMSPPTVVCPLDCTATDGAHAACHVVGDARLAPPAQPLALGHVRHAVAFLMHRQVARVAEQDHVDVRALVVAADRADGVVVRNGGCRGGRRALADYVLANTVGLLLQSVHNHFKHLNRHLWLCPRLVVQSSVIQ